MVQLDSIILYMGFYTKLLWLHNFCILIYMYFSASASSAESPTSTRDKRMVPPAATCRIAVADAVRWRVCVLKMLNYIFYVDYQSNNIASFHQLILLRWNSSYI